jgi:hypothetical protein
MLNVRKTRSPLEQGIPVMQITERPSFRAAQLAVLLARHYVSASAHDIASIIAKAQSATSAAKSWATRCCNESLDDRRYQLGQRRIDRMQRELNESMRHLPPRDAYATVRLGGDPRGACGYLVIPSMPGDGRGDRGEYAIY